VAGVLLILYVETHWILSCVLHQDAEAIRLFDLAEDACHVCLPDFCVAEAIARFRTIESEASSFRHKLEQNRREATRMNMEVAQRLATELEAAIREQDYLIQTLPAELSTFMESLFAAPIRRIPANHDTIRRASGYIEALALSRGDALVLSTILEHASTNHFARAHAFLSGNTRDFGPSTPAGTELRQAGVKFFSKTAAALGFVAANRS
jgi:hypothetical protein